MIIKNKKWSNDPLIILLVFAQNVQDFELILALNVTLVQGMGREDRRVREGAEGALSKSSLANLKSAPTGANLDEVLVLTHP